MPRDMFSATSGTGEILFRDRVHAASYCMPKLRAPEQTPELEITRVQQREPMTGARGYFSQPPVRDVTPGNFKRSNLLDRGHLEIFGRLESRTCIF